MLRGRHASPFPAIWRRRVVARRARLRSGDANITQVRPYTQPNIGIAREFLLPGDPKPMTVRFDVVNVFDNVYVIRDRSGIGSFVLSIHFPRALVTSKMARNGLDLLSPAKASTTSCPFWGARPLMPVTLRVLLPSDTMR